MLRTVVVQRKGASSKVQGSSLGKVDSSSLLVIIVVVVGSHLLQELAHHLGGLGAESERVSKDVTKNS